MIAYMLFLYLPSLIESSVKPEIQRINDTFVLVEYQDAFNNMDFSNIESVRLFQQTPFYKLLAVASITYEGEPTFQAGGVLVQPLEEGQLLLAKMDPCIEYKYVHVSVDDGKGKPISTTLKFSPSMFISEIGRWICYEDDMSVHLSLDSPENTALRSCADKVILYRYILSEGINQDIKISEYRKNLITYEKDGTSYEIEVNMISCTQQRKGKILQNTENWICMEDKNTINIFKQKWDNFEITGVYCRQKTLVQKLKFGLNFIEVVPFSVVKLIINFEDDSQFQSVYQLTQCSEKQSEDGLLWIWITVSIFVTVFATVVAVIIYCVRKNRRVAENLEMSPRAGPQQNEDTDYDPYDNAEEIYRIYSDDGGTYWTFASGNEMRQFENEQNSENV